MPAVGPVVIRNLDSGTGATGKHLMPSENFYSVAQAARRLGMTEADAVRAIAAAGVRPATTSPRVLFRSRDIEELFVRIADEFRRNRKREDDLDAVRTRAERLLSPEEAVGSSSGLFDLLEASKSSDDDDGTLMEQVRAAAEAVADAEDDSSKHSALAESSSGMFDCVRPEDLREDENRG